MERNIVRQEKTIFEKLFEINVNKHVEQKNGLSYLSWAYAWSEVKKIYPEANYKVYETENGCIYFTDGRTCWVKTGVTIEGLEHIEYLPVMDYRNKSISVDNITSFDVNKSIQRSLTKALARHGLGLYLYAGEDLPENEIEKISSYDLKILKKIINSMKNPKAITENILKANNIKSLKDLNMKQRTEVLMRLQEISQNEEKSEYKEEVQV